MSWVSSKCKKRSCVTLHSPCICRLTLAWISSDISTKLLGMPTHLDWFSFTAVELSHATGLFCCPVSTANCPSASPVANCLLYPTLWLAFSSYFRSRRDLESKPFVWFRAKTDKGIVCLADHLHNVTRRDSVFLWRFSFFSHIQSFGWKILFVYRWNIHTVGFFPNFGFLFNLVLLILV